MREILFRGKRIDNGKWIEGDLDRGLFTNIDFISYFKTIGERLSFEVFPESVSEFTGLTDKNGKKIFEGDIVIDKYSKEKFGFVGTVIYNPTLTQFQIYSDKQPDYIVNLGSRSQSTKVIGNIYDNPELLKGGAE
jgi:uncharacterized phage protein (TIGR01671 family)